MNDEIKKLETEIKLLKERIIILENREKRRKIVSIIKFLITLSLIIFVGISVYNIYLELINKYNSFIQFF